MFLRDRADILQLRLAAVKAKQCANKGNKYHCPEVFLDAVAEKLTTTADLFLDAELLSKFTYQVLDVHTLFTIGMTDRLQQFPRSLDSKFRSLSSSQLEQFAREDPKIRRHLDVVRRKDLLEHVLREIEALMQLEAREKRSAIGGRDGRDARIDERRKKKSWGLF